MSQVGLGRVESTFGEAWARRAWASAVPDRDGFVERGALFDRSEAYRYLLWRRWSEGPRILWVLLNPSTADETEGGLDPTLRRCVGFSRGWGFGQMRVCNAFALRSTDPKGLYRTADPVGPLNDQTIAEEAAAADEIIVGWGGHGDLQGRANQVFNLVQPYGVHCLAVTKGGEPGHPLYLAASSPRVPYRRKPSDREGRA